MLFISCQSAPKPEVDQSLSKPKDYGSPEIVLQFDEIRSPTFSEDGKFLAFVHWNESLKNPQIFEWDLTNNSLRQITHQVGRITEVRYLPQRAGVVYTSTTDEDKENPSFLRSFLYPDENNVEVLNTEIYSSKLDGSDIRRYTQNSGFDGGIALHPLKGEMIYSSKRGPFHILKKSNFNGTSATIVSSGKWRDESPKFSPNGNQIAWIRERDNQKSLLVSPAKYPLISKDITPEAYDILDFDWHPDSQWIVFSAKQKESSYYQLYLYHLQLGCVLPITVEAGNALEPVFHPDGKSVYYVIERADRYRLLKTSYLPIASCEAKK
ncbi:MAG: PD40 domain-containing protein [Bdellovibrionales bacterium]|nr:PD40 domain-containing protein [Bdellovibrionales bacterium]